MDYCRGDRNTGGAGHIPGKADAHPVSTLLCLGAEKKVGVKVLKGGVNQKKGEESRNQEKGFEYEGQTKNEGRIVGSGQVTEIL